MPRPQSGYRNAAGLPIPGTHDPIKRYMNSNGLIQWAYKRGKEGGALYDDTAVNIGSCVHMMAELDLKNRPMDEIDYYVEQTLPRYEDRVVAVRAFAQFRSWREQFHVTPVVQEVAMVSERHQYGGTPDTAALVSNGLGLLDFKTSKGGEVYPDMLLAMAAHGKLWIENNPGKPLTGGYHLIVLPKDGSAFRHMHYADLDAYWEQYKLLLQAYRMDKLLSSTAAMEGQAVTPSPQPTQQTQSQQQAPSRSARQAPAQPQQVRQFSSEVRQFSKMIPPQPQAMSMAEMLRSYGHVEGVRA